MGVKRSLQTFGEYFSCLLSSTVNKQLIMLLRKANDFAKPTFIRLKINHETDYVFSG